MKIEMLIPIVLSVILSSPTFSSTPDVSKICGDVDTKKCGEIIDKVVESIKSELEPKSTYTASDFFLDGLKLKSELGYTDATGWTRDAYGSTIETKIEDTTASSIQFGYFDKNLTDILRIADSEYKSKTWFDKNILDNLKMDMYMGYGNTITDPSGSNNFKTENESSYYVGLKYELEIKEALKPIKEWGCLIEFMRDLTVRGCNWTCVTAYY
jgi:hypothetical protein